MWIYIVFLGELEKDVFLGGYSCLFLLFDD